MAIQIKDTENMKDAHRKYKAVRLMMSVGQFGLRIYKPRASVAIPKLSCAEHKSACPTNVCK